MTDWGITQGARLKELRLKKGFIVPYVAKKIDCGEASIYRWELGQVCPRHKFLHDMAFLYNVTIEELTGEDNAVHVNPAPYIPDERIPASLIEEDPFADPDPDYAVAVSKKADELINMMAKLSGKSKKEMATMAITEYAQYVFDWNKALEGFCNEKS